jgi:hypothetical protein
MNHTQDQQEVIFYKRHARVKRMIKGDRTSPRDPRQMRRCLRLLSLTSAYVTRDEAPEHRATNARLYRKAIARTY